MWLKFCLRGRPYGERRLRRLRRSMDGGWTPFPHDEIPLGTWRDADGVHRGHSDTLCVNAQRSSSYSGSRRPTTLSYESRPLLRRTATGDGIEVAASDSDSGNGAQGVELVGHDPTLTLKWRTLEPGDKPGTLSEDPARQGIVSSRRLAQGTSIVWMTEPSAA